MSRKMIFHLFSSLWGLTFEMKRNFKHLVHETWSGMCGWMVLIFFEKSKTKSENHKICHDVMVSCMEDMVKNWEDFTHFFTYDVYKSKHLRGRIVALSIKFEVKVTSEIVIWLQFFSIDSREHRLFNVKFW